VPQDMYDESRASRFRALLSHGMTFGRHGQCREVFMNEIVREAEMVSGLCAYSYIRNLELI
jgi:hypothetical protein